MSFWPYFHASITGNMFVQSVMSEIFLTNNYACFDITVILKLLMILIHDITLILKLFFIKLLHN